ncbi:MAG: FAD-binding oxidoreductase [Gammaproteobacteria bacterium]|nr:FAD-binding oxidoreductase [Gammaproteobacteria bacterium]
MESLLATIVGSEAVSTDPRDLLAYGQDWTRFFTPTPSAVVFPQSEGQIREIVALARKDHLGLVPSGGRTGLSGGACATKGEIVVSFDKMKRVIDFDSSNRSVTVESGFHTAELQEFAKTKNLYYPVDFASSGSSQIGGNIATNAGGIRVLRYGMTRDWVSGLRVVTGQGECLNLNKGLVKNATGYDLRHLFIGSEGTLGFIVNATMQLTTPPLDASVVLLAIPAMEHCLTILERFRSKITLNAFEFFSDKALAHVLTTSDLTHPFTKPSPFFVLLEFEQNSAETTDLVLEVYDDCAADGIVTDAVVSTSIQQNLELWQYRERISESITRFTPYKNDVSVRISQIPAFLKSIDAVITEQYPDFEVVWFGHIGDGNLHLNILKPEDWTTDRFRSACEDLSRNTLKVVSEYAGSVSAEHGVGLLKKGHLPFSRSAEEIEAMKLLKAVFDPDGVMNPGKLL